MRQAETVAGWLGQELGAERGPYGRRQVEVANFADIDCIRLRRTAPLHQEGPEAIVGGDFEYALAGEGFGNRIARDMRVMIELARRDDSGGQRNRVIPLD